MSIYVYLCLSLSICGRHLEERSGGVDGEREGVERGDDRALLEEVRVVAHLF
jgi:hypothetical protein